MIPFRKSLAFRLFALSIILLALPLLVDSFIILQGSYKESIVNAKRNLLETAYRRELPLSEIQPIKRPFLVAYEYFFDLKNNFPKGPNKEFEKKLARLAEATGIFGVYFIKAEEDGKFIVVEGTDPTYIGQDVTSLIALNDIYSPEIYRRGYLNIISYDSTTLEPFFLIGRIIYSDDGKPIGIIMIAQQIFTALKKLLAPDDRPYEVNFALLLPSTIAFASSDPKLEYQYFIPIPKNYREHFEAEEPFSKFLLPARPLETKDIGFPFFEFEWRGERQVGLIKQVPHADFLLLVYASRAAILAAPIHHVINLYGVYLAIIVIGGTVAYFLTRRMAKPLNTLSNVMVGMQKGDLSLRYRPDVLGYEINFLGETFNATITTLVEQKGRAEEERVKRETLARELRIGQQVQRSLLPEKLPHHPDVQLAEIYIPAKEVGGDFFDAFVKEGKENEELVLAIADASGKGVQACFYSLGVRSMLRTNAREYSDVGKIMETTNALFCEDTGDTGMFVTVLFGIFDPKDKTFSYYSSGHNPAMIRRANGTIEMMKNHGIAMGLLEGGDFVFDKVTLASGDFLVLYTDGVTEAHDVNNHLFSEERLEKVLIENGDLNADEMAAKVIEALRTFSGEAPQHDDITLLIMRVN